GLPGGYPPPMNDVYQKRNHSLAETTELIARQPLQFEPGAKWAYCNAGIDTLGRVVEVVSGRRFEEFLDQRVFGPLGMADTTFHPGADQLKRLAVTYDKKDSKLVAVPRPFLDYVKDAKPPVPAGGLFSTGGDLAK